MRFAIAQNYPSEALHLCLFTGISRESHGQEISPSLNFTLLYFIILINDFNERLHTSIFNKVTI